MQITRFGMLDAMAAHLKWAGSPLPHKEVVSRLKDKMSYSVSGSAESFATRFDISKEAAYALAATHAPMHYNTQDPYTFNYQDTHAWLATKLGADYVDAYVKALPEE